MRRLLADRNARLYLFGQAFSLLGDTSLWLALGIWVKELTGSAGAAGLTFFFFSMSALLSPFAGMVVDRVRRRQLLLWTNVASAGMVLALFGVQSKSQVWLIYLVMFLYGVSYCFLGSGQSALLTVMLPEDLLGDANGMLRTVREGLRLIAPLVGAGLFVIVGGHVIALIDAATFLVAAGTLVFVQVEETTRAERLAAAARAGVADGGNDMEHEVEHWWAEITAGARHLWRTIELRQVVIGTAMALLVVGFLESLVFAVVSDGLHRAPSFLGVILAVQGCGALVGGPTSAPLMRRIGPGLLIILGLGTAAVGSALFAAPYMAVVFAGTVLFGIALPWLIVGSYTLLQLRTPNELQGRVYSAADTVLSVPQTLSIGLGAGLVGLVDYRLLLLIVSAVLACSAVYLVTKPEQRRRPGADTAELATAEAAAAGMAADAMSEPVPVPVPLPDESRAHRPG